MLHTIASVYRQPLEVKRFVELVSTLGVGLLLRQSTRSLLKFIPGFGSAVSGLYAGAATYALGCALCFYYQVVFDGHLPHPKQLHAFYQEKLAEGVQLLRQEGDRAVRPPQAMGQSSGMTPPSPAQTVGASRTPPVASLAAVGAGGLRRPATVGLWCSGTLWLYERHWLRWVGLALLCGEALLLWLARRWSRTEAALLPQPSAALPPTFAPRDEAAWALVQAYLERIERGEIAWRDLSSSWRLAETCWSVLQHTTIRRPAAVISHTSAAVVPGY